MAPGHRNTGSRNHHCSLQQHAVQPGADPSEDDLPELDSTAWIALGELSDGDRELLTLTAWEGLSAAEIAVVLDLRPNTVSVRLHRARRRFAAALAELDGTTTDELEVRR